jgi:hypothetical protein
LGSSSGSGFESYSSTCRCRNLSREHEQHNS